MSPTCCWRAPPAGGVRWRFEQHWEQDAGVSAANYLRKARCSESRALQWVWLLPILGFRGSRPRCRRTTFLDWQRSRLIFAFWCSRLRLGLAPALQLSKVDLTESLKTGSKNAVGVSHRLRSGLAVTEIALAVVL